MSEKPNPPFHPAAAIFPLLEGDAFTELKESIQRNGQRKEIVLKGGLVLDGRNRWRACQEIGIPPRTREFDPAKDGTSVLQFVLDDNLHRRHLSTSQRAVIAAEALKAIQMEAEAANKAAAENVKPDPDANEKTEPDGTLMDTEPEGEAEKTAPVVPTQAEAAAAAGVSQDSMSKAANLVDKDPEAAAEVASGKKTLNAADKEARDKEEKAKKEAIAKERREIKKRIRKVCGANFADAFDDGTVLKTAKETAAFLALEDSTMKQVAPLVATGWKVNRAAAHVSKEITATTTIEDLINHAIAEKGAFVREVNGFEIAVTKIES